jgi:hypothetical protein
LKNVSVSLHTFHYGNKSEKIPDWYQEFLAPFLLWAPEKVSILNKETALEKLSYYLD